MSEYESRERGRSHDRDVSCASPSHATNTPAPRTPAEQARDEISYAARVVNSITSSLEAVRQAHAANDPARWHEARGVLDRYIATAEKDLERARTRTHDAEPAARDQLAVAEAAHAQHVTAAVNLVEAPLGWKPVAREAELLAVLHAPTDGGVRSAFAQKEAELKAELARLSPAESHHLMARLNKRIAGDPVAAAIALLVPERRARLVSFLGDARRRAALTKVPIVGTATHRSNASPMPIELATTRSPSATSTSAAAEPVSFETQVRQMIDAHAPDLEVLAAIDDTKRRAMARRLEGYRPGSGDPLGARYVRLDRDVRQRFLDALLGAATEVTREQAPEPGVALTIAERGTRGMGERLPHLDRIQASFGSHDVTGIRAHIGGAAADATRQLGASGLAFGEHVAFASTPDLHTAAHEAAHYVQQRAGVALAGGIDQPGDEYEQHADHVADAVVRGESAVGLLDRFAGRGSTATPTRHAVQRKTGTGATPTARTDAHVYVEHHRPVLMNAIANRILDLGVPAPHEHLVWASREEGARAIANGIRSYLDEAPADPLHRLASLVTHDDLAAIVTRALNRSPELPSVGFAIASAFDHPVLESVQRIGTRTRARMDAEHETAEPSAAVTSNPLDRVVAQAMQGRVSGDALRAGQRAETRGRELRNGAREVEYKWMGSKSPDLWNWIVVTSPHDATVEDVATTPLAGGNSTGTEQAYRIAASPPYFGIPFETARLVKEAVEYAPAALRATLDHDAGPRIADPAALAGNTASDSAAIAQAPKATNVDLAPAHALSRLELELSTTQRALTPWQVDHPIGPALSFVARRRAELARSPSRATHWAPVLAAQERAVSAAASEISTLTAKIPAAAANPHHPMAATLAAYARAIGVSHLASQGLPALAEARHLREMLPLAIAEQQTADAGSPGAHVDAQVALDLATRAADLRAHAERDGKVDRAAVNLLSADAQEATLNAQLGSLEHTLAELNAMADEAGITSSNYENDLPTVRLAGAVLSKRIASWRRRLDDAKHYKGPTAGHTGDETVVEQRRNAMTQITTALANSIAEIQIDKYVEWASTAIRDQLVFQRIVKLVARLAGEIAIMIASMQIAGAAVTAFRGVMVGLELAKDVRSASLAVRIVTSIAAAGVQTVGQGAIGGEVSWQSFAENAVALATMTEVLGPFEGFLTESSALEADLRTLAQRAVRGGGRLAIQGTAGYVGSAASQLAVQGYVTSTTDEGMVEQGITLLVGELVHQRSKNMQRRLTESQYALGEKAPATLYEKAKQLGERARRRVKTAEDAQKLLADMVAAQREEAALYKGHSELEHKLVNEPSLGGDFAAVPLTLAHLETVVEGRAYIGTRAEIDHAIKALDDTGLRPERVESGQGTRKYRVGDHTIEFRERNGAGTRARDESGAQFGGAGTHTSAERWVGHLNTQLDPAARVRLRESLKGKSAQEVMDAYGGDFDAATTSLDSDPARRTSDGEHVEPRVIGAARPSNPRKNVHRLAPDVRAYLAGVDQVVMKDVMRLGAEDPTQLAALFRKYKENVVEYLRYHPVQNLAGLTKSLADGAKQVRHHVDHLYPNIQETGAGNSSPASGWKLSEKNDGTEWSSTITDPSGRSLSIGRDWDPRTGTLTMDTAFGAPKMDMVPTSPALIESTGRTPAMAYASLHQMRAMGIPYGKGLKSSPLKAIKMSTIQNIETIGHLRWLAERYPDSTADELIVETASFRYAEDIAMQAGYRVIGQHVDTSGGRVPLKQLLLHYENDSTSQGLFQQSGTERAKAHDRMLSSYGISADDVRKGKSGDDILTNFDIYIFVEPLP